MKFKVGDVVKIIKVITTNKTNTYDKHIGEIFKIHNINNSEYPYNTNDDKIDGTSWKTKELQLATPEEKKLYEQQEIEEQI